MAKVAYGRVSTGEQNIDRQLDAFEENGIEKVFVDKASGATTSNRPELLRMLDYVREGDVVFVESVSRLARSVRDLLNIVDHLRENGVNLVSAKESIDTRSPQGRFILSLFAALSELERETLLQRQREGVESARRRGKHLGRPRLEKPDGFDAIVKRWRAGEVTAIEAYRKLGISKASFYRLLKHS